MLFHWLLKNISSFESCIEISGTYSSAHVLAAERRSQNLILFRQVERMPAPWNWCYGYSPKMILCQNIQELMESPRRGLKHHLTCDGATPIVARAGPITGRSKITPQILFALCTMAAAQNTLDGEKFTIKPPSCRLSYHPSKFPHCTFSQC